MPRLRPTFGRMSSKFPGLNWSGIGRTVRRQGSTAASRGASQLRACAADANPLTATCSTVYSSKPYGPQTLYERASVMKMIERDTGPLSVTAEQVSQLLLAVRSSVEKSIVELVPGLGKRLRTLHPQEGRGT